MSTDSATRDAAPVGFWRPVTGGGIALVALGAALWGTDPLFRRGLALSLPTPALVLVEHLLPTVLLAPFVVRGLRRAVRVFGFREWLALLVLGCGASALATLLFTEAFTFGSPTTPVLLQQVQPLFAVAGARLLLGERLRPRFGAFLVAGLVGAYLIAFANPLAVGAQGLAPALLALAAAALWGTGTVLGRRLGALMPFAELTALRLFFGLIASAAVAVPTGSVPALGSLSGTAVLALVLLALVPGLLALLVYYRGLQSTPASAATLAELAFPLTTVVVNYLAFGAVLSPTQWTGVVLLAGTVTVMGTVRARGSSIGVVPVRPPMPIREAAEGL
ncbi:DMT family transporter [Amnibacterium sp.]|uniref:DMT family transporter n=1 Tax=Amnibacterium sp. TaxID=1872496 RepID=UPI00262813F8|nr:DMT family transporter [Amnibacterium sp.]MCU1474507.1 family transporter [Amnibacterium sp.]